MAIPCRQRPPWEGVYNVLYILLTIAQIIPVCKGLEGPYPRRIRPDLDFPPKTPIFQIPIRCAQGISSPIVDFCHPPLLRTHDDNAKSLKR